MQSMVEMLLTSERNSVSVCGRRCEIHDDQQAETREGKQVNCGRILPLGEVSARRRLAK